MRRLFNDGWSFIKTDIDCSYEEAMGKSGWVRVDIPHDWLIKQTKALYETSMGWYKKTFTVNNLNNVHIIHFDGVYMDSSVFVNGKIVGEWKYGYSAFEFDITNFLNEGENEIVVRICHREPNSRWYSGAGIFRNVSISVHESAYICSDSVYFSAKKSEDNNWSIQLYSEEINANNLMVRYKLLDSKGNLFCTVDSVPNQEVTHNVTNPEIWDVDSPSLYTLETTLLDGDNVIDKLSCKVGFRTIEFKSNSGFWLNGRNIKLNGVCLHHDLGALGAAFNKTASRRQLVSMKEMGANAVRTSHNMPAKEFLELCDELGLLVDSEAFDMWELKKTDYDYARFFDDWYKKDVASWIRRDRNHPSVIMWSIGNEIYDTHVSDRGVEVTKMLRDEVRKHDSRHNAYTTIGSNYIEWDGAQKCANELEISGYNYGERLYDEHHKKYPDWCIYGSETAARVQSRGVYHFPKSAAYITHDDLQCSSLENCRAGISERTAQYSIIADRDTSFSAGQFIWTGSDYIGEPSPYSTKNAYYGQIDTAGFRKDSFYLYKAAWTNKPVLHIMPYWDFNDGQLIDVMVYTNEPFVEMFFNGKSLGKKSVDGVYSADWQLNYEEGELHAVAYDKNGNITAEDSTRSFGETAEICLVPDKISLKTDGEDMIFLEISAYDSNGIFVANARNRVNVSVSGAGRLVGLDSGDSTDFDEYKSTSKKLFSGKLLALIKGNKSSGKINVSVSSEGLPTAEITLFAGEADYPEGASDAFEENFVPDCTTEIPVRKIELKSSVQRLDPSRKNAVVKAKILPEGAEYDIEWSAVTETGVVTNIATVSGNNDSAEVTACGDGKFRLRCSCRNGKTSPEVISELEMEIDGMGSAVVNPYAETVKGSLYNISNAQLDEVSEGGVKIECGGKNLVGFKNVDFGRVGSDSFEVSIINWHNNDEVKFSLWSGIPNECGSVKLGDFSYRADFVWQTYIRNSFKVSRKINGMRDICFLFEETNKRIYFGGFKFVGCDETYAEICAAASSSVRGDSFTVKEDSVEHIGNNVFMDFDGFNFTKGVKSITVKGRTHNAADSVHMRITGEGRELREILEFSKSEDYVEKTFAIGEFNGSGTVKFEFLPGCDFDFLSFKFDPIS